MPMTFAAPAPARAIVSPAPASTTGSPNAYAVEPVARKPLSRTKFGPMVSYLPSGALQLALVVDVQVGVLRGDLLESVGVGQLAVLGQLLADRLVQGVLGGLAATARVAVALLPERHTGLAVV